MTNEEFLKWLKALRMTVNDNNRKEFTEKYLEFIDRFIEKVKEETELKPCPFCGGTATIDSNYAYNTKTYFLFGRCEDCGAKGKVYAVNESIIEDMPYSATNAYRLAMKSWNKRVKKLIMEEENETFGNNAPDSE